VGSTGCVLNRMLKRVLWSEQEVTGGLTKLHTPEFHCLYFRQTSRWWNEGGGRLQDMLCYKGERKYTDEILARIP
jgi:hypothetical protein